MCVRGFKTPRSPRPWQDLTLDTSSVPPECQPWHCASRALRLGRGWHIRDPVLSLAVKGWSPLRRLVMHGGYAASREGTCAVPEFTEGQEGSQTLTRLVRACTEALAGEGSGWACRPQLPVPAWPQAPASSCWAPGEPC